jgi:competence protein ComEC
VARINAVLPADEAGITAAIVAGERGGINQKIIQNYRDSGLAHFLSISGLHMSMIAGIMFFLVRLLTALIAPISKRYNSKKIAAIFAILMSAVYLLISGAEIPSQRAFIMTFVVLLGV